jgi:hypothetical protein
MKILFVIVIIVAVFIEITFWVQAFFEDPLKKKNTKLYLVRYIALGICAFVLLLSAILKRFFYS